MQLGSTTRSVTRRNHAIIAPDGYINSNVPGWTGCTVNVIINEQMGARLCQTLVTLTEAALVWPDVPGKTWATWANRAELPDPAGWDERGRAQYRVGDLDVLAERRIDTARRGRRAG